VRDSLMFSQNDFSNGIFSGLIQHDPDVSPLFQPKLVLNDYENGRKTLEFILDNIGSCQSFIMAVAFVTRSGVACLHQTIKEFGDRGGTGTILVSTYLNFSDPSAIKILSSFSGIKVSFVKEPNYHGKTYLFEHTDYAQILVGSSNLTQNALGRNTEVNLGVCAKRTSSLYRQTVSELDSWLGKADDVSEMNLKLYAEAWRDAKSNIPLGSSYTASKEIFSEVGQVALESPKGDVLTPNKMQVPALERLKAVREIGQKRTLVISATGTGKTVLSAFDVKQFGARRLLFVVHRLNIARKAMSEFKRVFGSAKTMGIYSAGDTFDENADFIFCTVQTINTERHLKRFSTDEFDYIIIDETHRAGATTYKRVLEYFTPQFLLGMTATPERTDGFDIFSLFNHSVAYEIRLQKAMEADLLAPFHYFGVTDVSFDGISIDEKSDFNKLVSQDRVEHIISKIEEYGCDSGEVRGLIFCSRIEEAQELSAAFNLRGYSTLPITGGDSEDAREQAIKRLESTDEDKIDYLFTVDVFNEGVDIPQVNQVVMLRPTSSAIIFVQQLGRGLRKATGKEYVTVIDFIGNYQNNYFIPLALYGDSSYNKDRLRRLLGSGSSLIPGASSISFEKIARERIYASIDSAKLNTKKGLKEDYDLLKFRIGRTPMMMDFFENASRDPYQYVEYANSILEFTSIVDKEASVNQDQIKLLGYLSKHVCDGVRLEESLILEELLTKELIDFEYVKARIMEIASVPTDEATIQSAIHNLNLHFVTERSNNQNLRVSEVSGFEILNYDSELSQITLGNTLKQHIKQPTYVSYLKDLAKASTTRFLNDFKVADYVSGFRRGAKYTRKDVFRVLQWDKLPNAQNVGGYIVSSDGSNCPIFVTYQKEEHISESTKYEDRFVNPGHVIYMSKNRRTLSSPDVNAIRHHESKGMRLPFFVKKNDDEGLDFYYVGELIAIKDRFVETTMAGEAGTQVSVVKMEFMLDRAVDFRLYKYLTES
jgi:superfamily II DNA or RNA helicase/HKD family nuclease